MAPSDVKKIVAGALLGVRQALRGKLVRIDASKQIMTVQAEGLSGEPFNAMPYLQHPGFRSVPLGHNQMTIVPLHGKSANGVVVSMSDSEIFVSDLKPGETVIFNQIDGVDNCVVLRNGKIAEIICDILKIKATTSVDIDTPMVNMTHNLNVAEQTKTATLSGTSAAAGSVRFAGDVKADGDVLAGTVSLKHHLTPGILRGGETSDEPQQ